MRLIYLGTFLVLNTSIYYLLLRNKKNTTYITDECLSRNYGFGSTVCVCNSEHCDKIPQPQKLKRGQYLTYTSNKAGLRFSKGSGHFVTTNGTNNTIVINSEMKYQKVLGWGGAFTDATGINIASLSNDLQEKLFESYFSDDGIEYSLCRVPIGGTDFSIRGYSYDDGNADRSLSSFELAEEDYNFKIPYIKKASALTKKNLQLFASAWTAPKWMKTNGQYAGFGFLKQEFYQTWANYFVKFLDRYQEQGIEFWGITTGNEPHTVIVPGNKINTVGWNSTEMGKWITNNLGPAIRTSNHSDINILILDDQRIFLPIFVDIALKNMSADKYIDGIAVHWYFDRLVPASLLSKTHEHFPTKFILSTEACNGDQLDVGPVVLGSWERGEKYSVDIIEDMSNWVGGWVDWNMVLDLRGGPTYINNFVDSPVIVNASGGEFYKQPMYYHLGHFSKFVPKGSLRIGSSLNFDKNLMVVAFETLDDAIVVVVLNMEDEVVPVDMVDGSRGTAQLQLSERSITTILYW